MCVLFTKMDHLHYCISATKIMKEPFPISKLDKIRNSTPYILELALTTIYQCTKSFILSISLLDIKFI